MKRTRSMFHDERLLARVSCSCPLLKQEHFLGIMVLSSFKCIEIDTASEVGSLELDGMAACALSFVDKCLDLPAEDVEDIQCHMEVSRQLIADNRCGVEWVGVILVQHELRRERRS